MSTIGVVASATGGVEQLRESLIAPLLDRGHQVALTLTPTAAEWIASAERSELERITGLPVRSQPRRPGEPRPHPPIDVLVAAPASANTVAKLALGIGDNQALSVLSEGLGSTPMVVFPRVNAAHARHPRGPVTWRRCGAQVSHSLNGGRGPPTGGICPGTAFSAPWTD